MRRLIACLGLTLAAVTAMIAAPPAASAAPSSGINDWSCRPDAAHPEPVVLWHGLGATSTVNFALLAPQISRAGYCVFHKTYGTTTLFGPFVGGLASMRDSARELDAFVDQVRARTRASKVDIVGHSEGTTVPAYYMKFLGGGQEVNRFVGFGSNFRGTSLLGLQDLADALGIRWILDLGGCRACNEFAPGSAFTADLNRGGVTVLGPSYTSIVTRYDEIVTPYTSGILDPAPNVTNITLQDVCGNDLSGHLGLAWSPNVAAIVLNQLDPDNAKPITCEPVPWLS